MALSIRPPAAPDEPSAAASFVDRQTESAAISAALLSHVARCDAGEIDERVFRNIVSFYGIGGIGKTALSRRAETWISLDSPVTEWGDPPAVPNIRVARWELNDSKGNVDLIPFLISIRSALHGAKSEWAAFDLAFAAYFASLRPGQDVPALGVRDSRFADGFLSILSAIASDLGHTDLVTGLTSGAIRALLSTARDAAHRWRGTRINPEILDLVRRCLTEPSSTDQRPDLAAEVLWQLGLELDSLPVAERPNLVVFVDHFERIQETEHGLAEERINHLLTALPHALFVVTGRNMLDWYLESRTDLAVAGRVAWPGLVPASTEAARQHLLDRLSPNDTRALILRHRDREQIDLSDDVVEHLVRSTDGWPLHIDAVATYARRLREIDPDRIIGIEELGGSLQAVIRRLVDDLPDGERRAFQAACVLPFFDVALVRATAGQLEAGAITRFIARALVLENPGSAFPYRIHDEIRALVRNSSGSVSAGWGDEDWAEAAERAMTYAHGLFDRARDDGDDSGQLFATALALHIASENVVDPTWIAAAIRLGPTITGLRKFIPPSDRLQTENPARPMIELVEALDTEASTDVMKHLDQLSDDPLIGLQAALWAVYRARGHLHEHQNAVDRLENLKVRNPQRIALYNRQIAVTWSQCRRFRDAETQSLLLDAVAKSRFKDLLDRAHGRFDGIDDLQARVDGIDTSRRYQLEVMGTLVLARGRLGLNTRPELEAQLESARALGHGPAERSCLRALGYLSLYRTSEFDEIVTQIGETLRTGNPSSSIAELLALRTLATTRLDFAIESQRLALSAAFRGSAWIQVECYLERAGHPVEMPPTQWLQPREEVVAQWSRVADTIIDRAASLA